MSRRTTGLLVFVIVLFARTVCAQTAAPAAANTQKKYPFGLQAEISGGYGASSIENPDATKAHYTTIGVQGKGYIPVLGTAAGSMFQLALTGNVRYLDLKNTAEVGSQKEVANVIGPGGGIHLRLFKIVAGVDYNFMLARHYAVGPVSRELQYSMPVIRYYGGLIVPFNQLAVGFTWSSSSGTVPASQSQLSKSSPFQEQTYWLNFIYSTGIPFSNVFKVLF